MTLKARKAPMETTTVNLKPNSLLTTNFTEKNDFQVLELCVKFHLIAGYRLSELSDFDCRTNFAHNLESLKTLLVLLRLTGEGAFINDVTQVGEGESDFVTLCIKVSVKQSFKCDRGGRSSENVKIFATSFMLTL